MKMLLGLEIKYGVATTLAEYAEQEHIVGVAVDKLNWVTEADLLSAPWFLRARDKTGPYHSYALHDFQATFTKFAETKRAISLLFFGELERFQFCGLRLLLLY